MTLSIIIVSYNVKYFLEQCLCSVKEAIQKTDAEIIVIDNGSTDGSVDYLQQHFSWIRFMTNDSNEGFAKANNKALQMASGKYILFLNPDTILAEDTLERCIFFYKNHPDAGAIGVRMIDGSGNFLPESKRSFPSPMVSLYKLIGLTSLYPHSKRFGKYALGFLSEKKVHEVDVIAGAFMMIPKQILIVTSGFDEQFFMYAEDIDLSYRIQKAGFHNYYLGDITIIHFKGESTKKGSLKYVKVFYHAMSLFVKKWYRGTGAWLLRQALQGGILIREFISVMGLPFQKKKVKQQTIVERILLLGDEDDTNMAKQILIQNDTKAAIEITDHTDNRLTAFTNKLVVFCTGKLSYKTSIEVTESKSALSYKWFGKNSKSMVGSDNKNSSGEVFTGK